MRWVYRHQEYGILGAKNLEIWYIGGRKFWNVGELHQEYGILVVKKIEYGILGVKNFGMWDNWAEKLGMWYIGTPYKPPSMLSQLDTEEGV